MSTPKLGIIISSVREVRQGDAVGRWLAEHAREHGAFEVELLDLADMDIPLTTHEVAHPATGQYKTSAAQYFSRQVAACQAFVLVTPEYNHSFPASLKNALDLVFAEWNYKAAGVASYGGISGGIRAAEALKPVLTTLRMVPVREDVVLPMFMQQIEGGVFTPTDIQRQGATALLDELAKLTEVLQPLQQGRAHL